MRWNSIRTKLILFMLIATIVPTVATMVVSYSYTTDSLKRRAIEENRHHVSREDQSRQPAGQFEPDLIGGLYGS